MKRLFPLSVVLVLFFLAAGSGADLIENGDFKKGGDSPAGWKLSGGKGQWVDRSALEVDGDGKNSNYWRYDGGKKLFTPGRLYHFYMRGRRTVGGGDGCVTSGPSFANRDFRDFGKDKKWKDFVFVAPDNARGGYLRLGQFKMKTPIQFDEVRLVPAVAVHRAVGDFELGHGESIRDGIYKFTSDNGYLGSNYSRVLAGATASFNSYRWNINGSNHVIYRFGVPGCSFVSADVRFSRCHHVRGHCAVEASLDGKKWIALSKPKKVGTASVVPAELLPAKQLFIRLKGATPNTALQIDRVEFQGKLDGKPLDGQGETIFADIDEDAKGLAIANISLKEGDFSGITKLKLKVKNNIGRSAAVALTAKVSLEGSNKDIPQPAISPKQAEIPAGKTAEYSIDIPSRAAGKYMLSVECRDREDASTGCKLVFAMPEYYRSDYGKLISGGPNTLWWCDAAHKIAPKRPAPTETAKTAKLAAARNDFEAVQVVVRPGKGLKNLTATLGSLRGPEGAVIGGKDLQVMRVYYHKVENPTDGTGVRDRWPDALPPLDKPIDVAAGENQPLWILVHVGKDAKAGDYSGSLKLKADGWEATVPLALHVWDYALPERNHIDTAFGFEPGNVYRYHGLKSEADKRRVLDMYMQCFADHRISPYNPTPMDPIRVKFDTKSDPPGVKVDFTAFDKAMARAVEKYNFTGIRLPISGMGGGTFHARYAPKIGPFGEDTPQYKALFSNYVKQLETHFRGKGWLDMVYIYWFDEPAPRDYAFVRGGMERLRKYAPGFARMLTEQPEEGIIGCVDIWCPLTPHDDPEIRQACFDRGERMWWYVCCGPKAPYCTLFIDHPATEFRVWLWQTWKRDITGILIWHSNYWHSSTAFPNSVQNPYEDPMSYVRGYSTPAGTKRFWGNGDGRFMYPPLSAAVPGLSGKDPVIEPPVSSIRWEMLREGIEDYESLYLLRELLEKNRKNLPPAEVTRIESLLKVPEEITKSLTEFTTDPSPIYTRRAEVARAIEGLLRRSK